LVASMAAVVLAKGGRGGMKGGKRAEKEAQSECDVDCERGQKVDENCVCIDKAEECTPCGVGFMQDPWSCECINYYNYDAECKWGDKQDDACMCNIETWFGTWEKEPRCKKGFELQDGCSCALKEEWLCKPIKCHAQNQGWSEEKCACDVFPVCETEELECADEERWDKMACACAEKKRGGRKGRKGGKKGKRDDKRGESDDDDSDEKDRSESDDMESDDDL